MFSLAQLNRQAEDVAPKLSHIKNSGSIEEDCDIAILLNRSRKDQLEAEKNNEYNVRTQAIFAKNRHGAQGIVELKMNLKTGKFTSNEGKWV